MVPPNIRQRRLALKPPPSQLDLAARAKVHNSLISMCESGYVPGKRSVAYRRLLDALDRLERERSADDG